MKKKHLNLMLFAFFFFTSLQISAQKNSVYKIDTIYSTYLNEDRIIAVYLPADYDNQKTYPVIFTTDGQSITENNYAELLDSLIFLKQIPPIILIASYSNEELVIAPDFNNITYRNLDYLDNFCSSKSNDTLSLRFSNHSLFFRNEFIPYAENSFAISKKWEDRIFYGFSNGGAFGLYSGTNYPELFSKLLCFSYYGLQNSAKFPKQKTPPQFYLVFGTEEFNSNYFHKVYNKLKKAKYPCSINSYNGGHKSDLWIKEFGKLITLIFNEK